MSVDEALKLAEESGLDLVEVGAKSDPPVCRIMDYGKYKYQASKKQQDAKKKQKTIQVKEIKLRPKTEEHDFQFKLKHCLNFISAGNKVKVTVIFRGREMAFTEQGMKLLRRFIEETQESANVEYGPKLEGRAATLLLIPKK